MPKLDNVITQSANSVWKSPDGKREIIEVVLNYQGKELKAKTYSQDIGQVGWTGSIESYEKEGRNGAETFVKQPAKEGFSGGGGYSGGYRGGGGSKPQADPFTMYLSYAKDLVVAHINAQTKEGQMSLDDCVAAVQHYGHQLYDSRPGAEDKQPGVDPGHAEVAVPEQTGLDKIFQTEDKPITLEDTPWGKVK